MLELILKDISDRWVRENFFRLSNFFRDQRILQGDFRFFEVDIPGVNTNYPVKHGFTFIPKDIIVTSVEGNFNFYFKHQNFDETNIYINAAGACRLRFLAGLMPSKSNRVVSEPYTLVAPAW